MARFDLIDGSSDRFCIYTRDGKRSRARRMAGSELCFFHNPAMATERTAAQKSGGLRNKAAVLPADTPDLALVSPQQVTMLVAATINETRRGQVDPKVANAIGYLASILLKAIEKSELEERVSALETAVRRPPALPSRESNS